jgi:uncharacterized protein YcgI (DUF1989 family)
MAIVVETQELRCGLGWARRVNAGQLLRVSATSPVSIVAFNAVDLSERFDQARTKVYNMKLWLEPGDKLYSKLNNPMLTVVSDSFAPAGRHDLQLGACVMSGLDSGTCFESLATVLAPWKIVPHNVPMPLNAFQHVEIDCVSGKLEPTHVRLESPAVLDLAAEIDLVVAAVTCASETDGRPALIELLG